MTIAPLSVDAAEEVRPIFRELRRWRDRLRQESRGACDTNSRWA